MTLKFTVGDIVNVDYNFVNTVLVNSDPCFDLSTRYDSIKSTMTLLSYLDQTPCVVINKGQTNTSYLDDKVTCIVRYYYQVVPLNIGNIVYNQAKGINIYWEEPEVLDQIFVTSKQFVEDKRHNQVHNNTDKPLTAGQLVKISGYFKDQQILTVDAANASIVPGSVVFGVLPETIGVQKTGLVRWYRPAPFNPQ